MNEQPCDAKEETSTAAWLARLATLEAQIAALTAQACAADGRGDPDPHAPGNGEPLSLMAMAEGNPEIQATLRKHGAT